jgi:hypothetical protein
VDGYHRVPVRDISRDVCTGKITGRSRASQQGKE